MTLELTRDVSRRLDFFLNIRWPWAEGTFSWQNVFGHKFFVPFTMLIRSIKYRLIIKLITRMDGKSRGESIKLN